MSGWKSILTTPFRYEIRLKEPSYYNNRLRQDDRIMTEKIKAEAAQVGHSKGEISNRPALGANCDKYDMRKAELRKFAENHKAASVGVVNRKINLRRHKQILEEIEYERKANILVRRAALRNLYDIDYRKYQKELGDQRKAIYVERL